MVSSYQKKKQLPNHCLPQPEEEGKIPSIFSHKLTIHMLMHFFSHLLNKSKMLAHNQTHANLHKLLTALLMLGCGNRDRNGWKGATGVRLNY